MATNKVNLLWKSFKGIRKLNTINSAEELGADKILNVSLSKEKSGQQRSIRSSGWFNEYINMGKPDEPSDPVIRLFSANMSGYRYPNQLIAFTSGETINAWLVEDDSGILAEPVKIAEFPSAEDVTDVCMTQFGDRLIVVVAFGNNSLGYLMYSSDDETGWTPITDGSLWKYRSVAITESSTQKTVGDITQVRPYGARLAINGGTRYEETGTEFINGVWFSEAGNPLNFAPSYASEATETSAFFIETGEYANKLVEYNGLTVFCRNRSYNIRGTSQNDIVVQPLTAKGVFGNAVFVMNGQCAYVDSYAKNAFILTNNIDGTIGVDSPIGNDIQDYLQDVENVSINSHNRRVRLTKESGQSLVYDVDIAEWTSEQFTKNARVVEFLNKELFCDGTTAIKQITETRQANSKQLPTAEGFYSYYKTNLIWLDSQTSVKSHIYPLAVILEQQTNNVFFIRFTTDRKEVYEVDINRPGNVNVAMYSDTDEPKNNTFFVEDDEDISGGVFFSIAENDLLETIDRPPYWRYLQIEIYTKNANQEFNISGIESKQTFITDELLDY